MQLNKPFATVAPTLDGDVLTVLANADATFTIAQVQRILTTPSDEGIRKALNRLTRQGVVLHGKVGRTHTYRLNTEHLAAEPITALARLNSTFLDRLERHLDEWGKALRYAAVFGSAATGRMTIDSDIDLLLVRTTASTDDTWWEQKTTDLAQQITAWTGNDARIIEYNDDELHTATAAGEPLLQEVARDGLTVAGTRSWLITELRSLNQR
ncbi:nucleotidyltransferase family protein [Gordonia malaquae]|uniref:nucleotidyltransferase family protein n=1 Tax=Gordonia malaquae TaxID=410332 RepID=UPI00301AA997